MGDIDNWIEQYNMFIDFLCNIKCGIIIKCYYNKNKWLNIEETNLDFFIREKVSNRTIFACIMRKG